MFRKKAQAAEAPATPDLSTSETGVAVHCQVGGCERTRFCRIDQLTSVVFEGAEVHIAATVNKPADCTNNVCATSEFKNTISAVGFDAQALAILAPRRVVDLTD